jgi:type III restriction enzyme
MKRIICKFRIDKDAFIDDCIFDINQGLLFWKASNEYKEETAFSDKQLEVEICSDEKSDFKIANFIMYHTMLPRLAIFKIYNTKEVKHAGIFMEGTDRRRVLLPGALA